jgi:hypothetical protein
MKGHIPNIDVQAFLEKNQKDIEMTGIIEIRTVDTHCKHCKRALQVQPNGASKEI